MQAHEVEELNELLSWFDDYLDAPTRFARSKNKHAHEKALSWFKPEADEHIDRARVLLALLGRHGVMSEMLTTAKPGMIIYEDDWQVAAIPFKDKDF
ncbi:hypothetical protein CW354_15140 [Marinicaulis flavus]|uniref:Uncharacterized protein n=1 Tax=Hyphococcus luteus TaxID=2058213 RepID=A0A2S7K2U6_9PROT|nr:hypothetical protein CW354_15140 [Marinicaulis flavus]